MAQSKKKSSRKRKRPNSTAALLGAMAIRCCLLDAQAADEQSWMVIRVDPSETRSSGEVVAIGNLAEVYEWVAAAESGRHYVIAQMKNAKGLTK